MSLKAFILIRVVACLSVLSLLVPFKMNFKFQTCVCNSCQDLIQNSMSFDDVPIAYVRKNNYKLIFGLWLKVKPQVRSKNFDLKEKNG